MKIQDFIHPSSVVEAGAQIGDGARIGPFCHVSADAVIGDRVELVSHVSVMGATTIGASTKVYPMAILGAPPQNTKHKGGRTTLVIGANCTIREGVTMHVGTDTSRGETTVGDNGNFLAYAHIAHDCVVGNNATFANGATLGGHCEIGNNVYIGGLTRGSSVRARRRQCLPRRLLGDRRRRHSLRHRRRQPRQPARPEHHRPEAFRPARVGNPAAAQGLQDDLRPFPHGRREHRTRQGGVFGSSPTAMKIIDFISSRGKRHYAVPSLKGGERRR